MNNIRLSSVLLILLSLFLTGCPDPGILPAAEPAAEPAGQPQDNPEPPAAPEAVKLVLFSSSDIHPGDFGGRAGADAIVKKDAPDELTNVHAFLSVAGDDEIRDMAAKYGYPADLPVVGADGVTVLADSLSELLSAGPKAALASAGIFPYDFGDIKYWWSGSSAGGEASDANCSAWTEMFAYGTAGSSLAVNESWLASLDLSGATLNDAGEQGLHLLGLGVSMEEVPPAVPLESISFSTDTLKVRAGDSLRITWTQTPADANQGFCELNLTGAVDSASISQDGLLTAKKAGDVTVTGFVYRLGADGLPEPVGGPEDFVEINIHIEPDSLTIFATTEAYSANVDGPGEFGGYERIRSVLINSKIAPTGSRVIPFITRTSEMTIANLPDREGFPSDIPVFGPNGKKIADNWQDLTDGTIDVSLGDAGVVHSGYPLWWSGSTASGTFRSTAGEWTSVTGTILPDGTTASAAIGDFDSSDHQFWISRRDASGDDEKHYFLGIYY